MANGVVATSKALKGEKVVCISKQAGQQVRDQLGYTTQAASVSEIFKKITFVHPNLH